MNRLFRILIALMLFFTGCTSSQTTSIPASTPKDDKFYALIPNCEMSGMVEFTPHLAEFSIGKLISLGVGNISKEQVGFPADYNVRISSYDEGAQDWFEVVNDVQYISSSGDLLQPVDSGLESYSALVINPIVTGNAPVTVRVVIWGNIIKNNQELGDCVGAFTEITLSAGERQKT